MESAELGHEIRGILGCVDCKGSRDDKQRPRKLGNGKLLARILTPKR